MGTWRFSILCLLLTTCAVRAGENPFPRGLPQDDGFFPLAVWLQDPKNADRYRDLGINLYVGLWRGPTAEQLDALDQAGIRVFCGQSERSLRFRDRPTIVGWLQDDEPDNAQSLGKGKGYGPPITPSAIIERYQKMRAADPDRPILLNLGQGVAWDGWHGRGVRTNHPEDYPEYVQGGDLVSFDIYPASHQNPAIAGNLWYVPKGVERLRRWTRDRKDVWCCIETTRINNPATGPTPRQVRAEVWMALIHGARGLIYFSHQFQPRFIEAGLLADEAMSREVSSINHQIRELAPALHGPDLSDFATVESSDPSIPIAFAAKSHGDATYLFAVSMRPGATTATFRLATPSDSRIEVLGEDRTLNAPHGVWSDPFQDYQVHLYRIHPTRPSDPPETHSP